MAGTVSEAELSEMKNKLAGLQEKLLDAGPDEKAALQKQIKEVQR